ncbi:Prolyl endopeptidase FAP [Eumeta japonica]|uniref:Prolyl endopeptidase FAP n=1 Tax=Eumeta variegata TaxID=151549 RepID=A0A4C1SM58_EUMVA|nr:Prolyl endopeptidase FAP [Eumeta japonica]
MTQESSNSAMEMGTSDQELIAAKRKKRRNMIIGGIILLVVIAVTIALIVIFSASDPQPEAEAETGTTEGPTLPTTTTLAPTEDTTTTPTTMTTVTTMSPSPEPDPILIDLESIINGVFSAPSFNGSWVSGNEVLYRNQYAELVLFDVNTGDSSVLVQNSSEILQAASRVAELSPDRTQVVLAHSILPRTSMKQSNNDPSSDAYDRYDRRARDALQH